MKKYRVTIDLDAFEIVVSANNKAEAKRKAIERLQRKKITSLIRESKGDMSKDNITEPVNTWDNFYQSRVCNDSYVNVFCKKYNRFIEEIIINIQQISYDLKAPLILKEEGCGIGTVSLAISQIGERLFNYFGLTGASDAKKISKVIFSDINIPMLELCCKNTLSISTDNYLGKVPLFYVKENICEPKFFESSTVVVTHGVLEHFSDVDITRIMSTYNNDKVLFQAHYVPTSQYTSPSFGDERLLPTDYWITLVKPDYYLLDNNGKDLYMFKTKPAPTRR